ncbi:MAG: hypothetical protein ACXW3E_15310 [Thermoanaerobaculia bacterium]
MNDGHDRYANIDNDYLLEQIETHEGPVIVTTNRDANLDGPRVLDLED